MTQPAMQTRFFQSIQQGPASANPSQKDEKPAALNDREKVKEMFFFSEKVKTESMHALQLMMTRGMQYDFAVEAMVQQSYMQDRLFIKYGVEEEDMMAAVVAHQIQKDPDVIQVLKDTMKSMPPDVMQSLTLEVCCGGGGDHDH